MPTIICPLSLPTLAMKRSQQTATTAVFNFAGDALVLTHQAESYVRIVEYPSLNNLHSMPAHLGGSVAAALDPRGRCVRTCTGSLRTSHMVFYVGQVSRDWWQRLHSQSVRCLFVDMRANDPGLQVRLLCYITDAS